jgi:hypothetical protein
MFDLDVKFAKAAPTFGQLRNRKDAFPGFRETHSQLFLKDILSPIMYNRAVIQETKGTFTFGDEKFQPGFVE